MLMHAFTHGLDWDCIANVFMLSATCTVEMVALMHVHVCVDCLSMYF